MTGVGDASMTAAECLAGHMADAETQWSLGTFGAIAEFARDPGEPVTLERRPKAHMAVTERGGIRIVSSARMRLFAFETTTKESWSPRVALCLPQDRCVMNRRGVLTELGADRDALRAQDRTGILFDFGIGALQVDACVRVSDPQVAAQLRSYCGQPTFAPGNPAVGLLLAHSPHRVFTSRIGRIEVYQPIPPAGGKSPDGPHTHVLLELLRHRRTHAATEPIPGGLVPCAHFYPAHPAKNARGERRPFDPHRYAAFERVLQAFGDPQSVTLKQRVRAAVLAGEGPAAVPIVNRRFDRTGIRVALRQLRAADQSLPALAAWLRAHERATALRAEEDPHVHHR
jgi:Family of unknown function (DUF6925)